MKNLPKRITKNWKRVVCENCGKKIWKDKWHLNMYPHSYCGYSCQYESMRGTSVRPETLQKRKMSLKLKKERLGYIISPEARKSFSISKIGAKNPAWKGGRVKVLGYVLCRVYDHPFSNKKGYVMEHRLVMEKKLKRYLKPHEKVHHRNAIKDNNRMRNLEIVVSTPHHGKVECPKCDFKFLIR